MWIFGHNRPEMKFFTLDSFVSSILPFVLVKEIVKVGDFRGYCTPLSGCRQETSKRKTRFDVHLGKVSKLSINYENLH